MAKAASQCEDIFGNKLYQKRARRALPILVRQAASRRPIVYEALAGELGMRNPRNLNYVLGSIGRTLNELSGRYGLGKIPHIQSLVINKTKKLPGHGFDGFLADRMPEFRNFSVDQKRAYLDVYWHEIGAYPYWLKVLEKCELKPASSAGIDIIEKAKTGRGGGGGEGKEHRELKDWVANNPILLDLPPSAGVTTEAPLPSGDKIDVLFDAPGRLVAVEVKSKISNNVDLARGLFQCVKYRAVMEAERGFRVAQHTVEVLLVVGRRFPEELHSLRNSLGIRVEEIIDWT